MMESEHEIMTKMMGFDPRFIPTRAVQRTAKYSATIRQADSVNDRDKLKVGVKHLEKMVGINSRVRSWT